MPKSFREAEVDWEMCTFEWEVSVPSFLNILVFELSQRTGTVCWFKSMLGWGGGVINALRHLSSWRVLIPRGFVKSWKQKFGHCDLCGMLCVGTKGLTFPREDEGCGPREGLAV